MKCPNCGQSLWVSRTFCPFCKTAIPRTEQPRVAQSVILNRAVFTAWCVWFAYQIFFLATQPIWNPSWRRSIHSSSEWGAAVGGAFEGPVLIGIAAWLAWRLYVRPPRLSLTIWFLVICALLIWKYWVSAILLFMLPAFGGSSLLGAVAQWWSASTSTLDTALVMLLPPPFLIFSMIYWPIYCRRIERQDPDYISSLIQRLRQSDQFKTVSVGVGILVLILILSIFFSR